MNAIKKEFKRMREDYKKQMDKYKAKDEEKRKRLEEKKKLKELKTPTEQKKENVQVKKVNKRKNERSSIEIIVEAIWTLIHLIPFILGGIFVLVLIGGLIFMFLKSLFS